MELWVNFETTLRQHRAIFFIFLVHSLPPFLNVALSHLQLARTMNKLTDLAGKFWKISANILRNFLSCLFNMATCYQEDRASILALYLFMGETE